jgi:hypothetical protein
MIAELNQLQAFCGHPILLGRDSTASSSDKPSNRKVEEFYDNSILEELAREGFIKATTNK